MTNHNWGVEKLSALTVPMLYAWKVYKPGLLEWIECSGATAIVGERRLTGSRSTSIAGEGRSAFAIAFEVIHTHMTSLSVLSEFMLFQNYNQFCNISIKKYRLYFIIKIMWKYGLSFDNIRKNMRQFVQNEIFAK